MPDETYSFIIRIWADSVDDAGQPANWRGYIDLVGGEKRLYFQELESVTHFINQQAHLPANRPRPWWHWLTAWLHR